MKRPSLKTIKSFSDVIFYPVWFGIWIGASALLYGSIHAAACFVAWSEISPEPIIFRIYLLIGFLSGLVTLYEPKKMSHDVLVNTVLFVDFIILVNVHLQYFVWK